MPNGLWLILLAVALNCFARCDDEPAPSGRFKLQVMYLLNTNETASNPKGSIRLAYIKPAIDLAQQHANERYSFDIKWVETDIYGADKLGIFDACNNLADINQVQYTLLQLSICQFYRIPS